MNRAPRNLLFLLLLSWFAAAPSRGGDRFHGRFEAETPFGPVSIFEDGFESQGWCPWTASQPCTLWVFTIADGTNDGSHGFPLALGIHVGATFRIVNGDVSGHRIHAEGSIGLDHQFSTMGQGGVYEGVIDAVGTDIIYCHDHGTDSGEMLVTASSP